MWELILNLMKTHGNFIRRYFCINSKLEICLYCDIQFTIQLDIFIIPWEISRSAQWVWYSRVTALKEGLQVGALFLVQRWTSEDKQHHKDVRCDRRTGRALRNNGEPAFTDRSSPRRLCFFFLLWLGAVLILRACLSDDYKDAFKRGKRRLLCVKEKGNKSRRVSRLLVILSREEEEREREVERVGAGQE